MILVTGATGLVGGNLIWHLLKENERVTAIRRPTSNLDPLGTVFRSYTSTPELYLSRIVWKIADVLDEKSLMEAMKGVSVVYHCAAIVSFDQSSETITDTNISGTRNVVRAALESKIDKLCFVSSIAACGNEPKGKPIDENSLWSVEHHHSAYSLSKYYSEQEVWKGIKQGLNAVIINPGVILGVSGTDTGSSQLFSQVQKGMLFYTNGGSGYIDVRDVVKAMILLTNSNISGERFVLVGENCSNKEIISWMADGFGKHRPIFPVGKLLLRVIGSVMEIAGKIFHFHPLIDREMATIVTQCEYYSSTKIKVTIGISFNPVELCIREICRIRKRVNYKI